jgi:hypothetical protein
MKYEYYIPVVVVVLVLLVLGHMNPVMLQSKKSPGNPNYMLWALVLLLVGVASTYLVCEHLKNKRVSLSY